MSQAADVRRITGPSHDWFSHQPEYDGRWQEAITALIRSAWLGKELKSRVRMVGNTAVPPQQRQQQQHTSQTAMMNFCHKRWLPSGIISNSPAAARLHSVLMCISSALSVFAVVFAGRVEMLSTRDRQLHICWH
jgi:polysaccharide pyruvyl transferase WcaK-like protein